MQRRTRPPAARQIPLSMIDTPMKQTQSRAAALVRGERDFRKSYDDADDPFEDNNIHVKSTTASYSEELLDAFKRKTQALCDETREQYEQKLERQEIQHEQQVQKLQRQLREVMGSCVSLAEHEQILAMQVGEIRRRHQSEIRELEQVRQAKLIAMQKHSEQAKADQMQRIEKLKMLKSEAAAEAKERELSELRWGEKLGAAGRAKQTAEQRLEEACRIIAALKTRLHRYVKMVESQRDKTIESRDEVMKCKLAYAELKGDMDTRIASLEKELDYAQRTSAEEKANTCKLQTEVTELREQMQHLQCSTVELTTKGALNAEHYAAERRELQNEIETLEKALQVEKQVVQDSTARLDKMKQHIAETQLHNQDLRTRAELQQDTETKLKQQIQRLKQRLEQFKAVVEKLHTENKQLGDEMHNRDASTEAWAKKLFGQRHQ